MPALRGGRQQRSEPAGDGKIVGLRIGKTKPITRVGKGHDTLQQVITVGPLAGHMQGEIDLGGRQFEKARLVGEPAVG